MADNKFYGNEKVFVDADFDNIVVIDPNKVVNLDGTVDERLVNHENLVMYANLEARIIPRTKLAAGSSYSDSIRTVGVGQLDINFLKGNQFKDSKTETNNVNLNTGNSIGKNPSYMDTNWSEQFLFDQRRTAQDVDTQLLGITRISIKMNASYVPEVTIEMTDIQGRVLFEYGDLSPYGVFFQLPYPVFILTVKGYYGKAIKLELMLKDFNARFDPSDGSYKVTTTFISRSHALLSDTLIDFLYATPHMYSKSYEENITNTNTTTSSLDSTVPVKFTETTKGLEKLRETYRLYKEKGLVDESFPEITLNQMIMKLEQFNKVVMESYQKEDMSVLTNIVDYETTLNEYRSSLFPNITNNWFNKYIDTSTKIVLKGDNQPLLYLLKPKFNQQQKKDAFTSLTSIIEQYNKILDSNPTFGGNGKYTIEGKTNSNSGINNTIKIQDFIKTILDYEDIDFEKTYSIQKNGVIPTPEQLVTFKKDFITELNTKAIVLDENFKLINDNIYSLKSFIIFGDKYRGTDFSNNSFLGKLSKIEEKFKELKEDIEKQLSESLAKKIESSDIGLGFKPTINNVLAVICANSDAFYKLMDDVHTNAWEVRNDPVRLQAVIPPEKLTISSDGKIPNETVFETIITEDGTEKQVLKDTSSVYPWPQYFEKVVDGDNVTYEIRYPGNEDSYQNTQAWNYKLWPEVEFVEEYLRGSLERDKPIIMPFSNNQLQNTPYIFPSAIEFPFQSRPYLVADNLSFMYEIWERTYLDANYTKFAKNNNFKKTMYQIIGDFEVKNIEESIKDNPSLKKILKDFNFTYDKLNELLRIGSINGQGVYWNQKIRDNFTNTNINSLIERDFGIYNQDSFNSNSTNVDGVDISLNELSGYLASTDSNNGGFLDTYPFNDLDWLKNNLSNGDTIGSVETANSTTKILNFDLSKKTFTTFNQKTDTDTSKTYLTYLNFNENTPENPNQILSNTPSQSTNNTGSYVTLEQARQYYQNRTFDKQYLTEAPLDYGSNYNTATNNIISKQTTSLLNTPYFVNSILKSVENRKNNIPNPNVTLGYIYLNSLPLSTLSEKYLTQNQNGGNNTSEWLDYIFAGFNKFSAIHKMAYLWILKYGSIWYRYKKYQENSVDILDDVWEDFDYFDGYDPLTQDFTKQYQIKNYTGGTINYNTEEINTSVLGVITNEELIINNGLYPKVINSLYYFFTGKDVFTNYTQQEWNTAYADKGLRIGLSNRENIQNYDNSNPNRSLDLRSWFQYFNISGSTDFTFDTDDKLLLVPSSGYLKFNQSKLECFNNLNKITQPIQANNAIQNGNVRSFWNAPNFGYFNNDWIKKPNINEYIKIIDNSKDRQFAFNLDSKNSNSTYKSIEEIFAVFKPDILDEFERHFLNFCKDNKSYENIITNPTIINQNNYNGDTSTEYLWNIEEVMESLFIIDKPSDLTNNNSINDVSLISNTQANNFVSKNSKELTETKIILKIGNPGNFNRRVFNSFSDTYRPTDPIFFGNYIDNTLPTSNNNLTLTQSINNNPAAWKAMYLYVGEYVEPGMKYSDNGSYLTDFFVDMKIQFTEDNVIKLAKIIQIYGSIKKNNPQLTDIQFKQQFDEFLKLQSDLQNNVLNHIFTKLNRDLPEIQVSESTTINTKLKGNVNKNELWTVFKNFNDRWISGQDFKGRTLFEEFLFMDKANRPIGNDVVINVEDLRLFLRETSATDNIFKLVGDILQKNNFIFMPVPTYANFYGRNKRSRVSSADPNYANIADDVFGTFLEVDTYGSEPKFLAIYVGKTSEHLVTSENNKNFLYKDDSFNIAKTNPNPLIVSENTDNVSDRNKVVGFNVDFGVRNQGIFKSISLDMAQRKNIAPTFQVLANMGSMAEGQKVAQQSANLYDFYRNGSYNCTVTSMGNAMIQPTMYFNLKYVPMFYGAYLILNVTHDITTKDFITTFEGVRVPRFSLQKPDGLVASVNLEIVQSFKNQIRRLRNSVGANTEIADEREQSIRNSATKNNNKTSTSENNCTDLSAKNVIFVDYQLYELNATDLRNLIDQYFTGDTYTENVKKYAYSVAFVESGVNNLLRSINYNLYNFKNDKTRFTIPIRYDKQVCIKDGDYFTPQIAFDSFSECIIFMKDFIKSYNVLINSFLQNDTIDNDLAKAFTYIWYYTLRYTTKSTVLSQTGLEDDEIIRTIDVEIKDNTQAKTLFDESYITIKKRINEW